MSGNNVPISPRPIVPAPKISGNDSQKNGNRKLAPRPIEETKPALKVQPNTRGKEIPTSSSNGVKLAPAPSTQQAGVMTGSYVLRPVSSANPNRAVPMYPFFSATSNHPQLQQRLQSSTETSSNKTHTEIQSKMAATSVSQTLQQRPSAPIPIAPRPTSIPTSSTSISTSTFSTATAPPTLSATTTPSSTKPPKICPRPIEKKSVHSVATSAAATPTMNGTPPNIIPSPMMSNSGAAGYILQNGAAVRFPQHPSAALGVHFQNHPQLRFAFNGQPTLNGMQIQHLNSMSIFPQAMPQQIFHPSMFPLSSAAGGGTFISQNMPSTSQFQTFLPISAINANQLPSNFLNQFNPQQLSQGSQMQQQSQQQPKLIPITVAPLTLPTTASLTTAASLVTASTTTTSNIPIAPSLSLQAAAAKLLDPGSDDDENEPPPSLPLFREETLAIPASVHEAFVQEASGVRMQFPSHGENGETLRHVIDGFVIEESSAPFEIDDVIKEPLEILKQHKPKREPEEEDEKKPNGKNKKPNGVEIKKRARRSNNGTTTKVETAARSPSPSVSSRKRRSSSSTRHQHQQQQRPSSSSTKSIKLSPPTERPKSSRKSRELEGLLSMDFGKNPVFKTTSVAEFTKEVQRQQTALRPAMQHDYKERATPERTESLDLTDERCLHCKHTFIELGRRYMKSPQYCSKECRKELRKSIKRKSGLSETRSLDYSDFNPSAAAAALLGHSPESSSSNNPRKRISDGSGTSTPSPRKSSPLKLKMRSSSDLETLSNPSILSPPPTTSLLVQAPTNSNTPEFSKSLTKAGLNATDVGSWNAEDVEKWVNSVTNCQTYGEAFRREEIDGSSLLMLNSEHLKTSLGIRLGPALKIEKAIEWLRRNF